MSDSQPAITAEEIAAAESLLGLDFSPAQREQMREIVSGRREQYESLRAAQIGTHLAFILHYNQSGLSISQPSLSERRASVDLAAINRQDVLLAIIDAADERGLKRVHLQKAVFLVAEEFSGEMPDDFYKFVGYHFGPYSQRVYQDAEMLNDSGCISIRYGKERRDDHFAAVDDCGIEAIELPKRLERFIKESVDWIADMDFQELVRAIYYLYPEYQENSRFVYDEEQAIIESFARSLKQSREGKTHSTADVMAQLQEI